jgi:hypothetical protein
MGMGFKLSQHDFWNARTSVRRLEFRCPPNRLQVFSDLQHHRLLPLLLQCSRELLQYDRYGKRRRRLPFAIAQPFSLSLAFTFTFAQRFSITIPESFGVPFPEPFRLAFAQRLTFAFSLRLALTERLAISDSQPNALAFSDSASAARFQRSCAHRARADRQRT